MISQKIEKQICTGEQYKGVNSFFLFITISKRVKLKFHPTGELYLSL